jgi:hypothetical protein
MVRGKMGARTMPDRESVFQTEHGLAYGLMALAMILGFLGLMRGFGVIGGNDASNTPIRNFSALMDGVVWLLPAISMSLLAWAFHNGDHHRMRDPERLDDADQTAWKTEHMLADIMAAGSVIFALLGILTGFHLLGRGDTQVDSMPWHLASIAAAALTNALHSVRHHQLSSEDVFVVARREEGVVPAATPARMAGDTGEMTGTARGGTFGDRAPTQRR